MLQYTSIQVFKFIQFNIVAIQKKSSTQHAIILLELVTYVLTHILFIVDIECL